MPTIDAPRLIRAARLRYKIPMRFDRFDARLVAASALVGLACLTGCSDPVPPTPQGAWSVSWVQGDPVACGIPTHNSDVGKVSAADREVVVVDGIDGARVSCEVTGAGKFNVHGKASHEGVALEIKITDLDASATEDAPRPGQAAYSSQAKTAGNVFISDTAEPCNFYFTPETKEGVSEGKIWVAFHCPKMLQENNICSIQQGYALLENCASEAVDE